VSNGSITTAFHSLLAVRVLHVLDNLVQVIVEVVDVLHDDGAGAGAKLLHVINDEAKCRQMFLVAIPSRQSLWGGNDRGAGRACGSPPAAPYILPTHQGHVRL